MDASKKLTIVGAATVAVTLIVILAWPSVRLAYHKRAYMASVRKRAEFRSSKSPDWALEIRAWFSGSRSPHREIEEDLRWHRRRLHELGFLETREFVTSNRVNTGRLVKAGSQIFMNQADRYWSIGPLRNADGSWDTNRSGVSIEAPTRQMEQWQTLVLQCQITNTPPQ